MLAGVRAVGVAAAGQIDVSQIMGGRTPRDA